MKIKEVLELTFMMLFYTLMPFIEEVVNLSLPLEESFMHHNWLLNLDYKNPYS